MSTSTAGDTPDFTSAVSQAGAFRLWFMHLLVFAIPLSAVAFVWSGPHAWYVAPLFIVPLAVIQWVDTKPWFEFRQPDEALPTWPFDMLVYGLALIHFVMLAGLVHLFLEQGIFSLDTITVVVVVGGSSGFSIITAHELIHRRQKPAQLLGRLMLASVLYEHFYTEHLRGHHVRVGLPEDPATARYGETFPEFWRRTVPGQFRSAWRLECARLGDVDMSLFDRRTLSNRVLHGVLLGWGIAFGILAFFGWPAFLAYLLQAFIAVRLLEAVNYFEHWGLERSGRRVQPTDSWDTHSGFTYYGLVGLSRHADHHTYPSRAYQSLRVCDEAPVLPVGYVALVDMVLANNDEFIRIAKEELRSRELGPFSSEAGRKRAEAEDLRIPPRPVLERALAWMSPGARKLIVPLALLAGVSLGGWFFSGADASLGWVFLRNAMIAGLFVSLFFFRNWLESRVHNGWVSWGAGLLLLWVVGTSTQGFLG